MPAKFMQKDDVLHDTFECPSPTLIGKIILVFLFMFLLIVSLIIPKEVD